MSTKRSKKLVSFLKERRIRRKNIYRTNNDKVAAFLIRRMLFKQNLKSPNFPFKIGVSGPYSLEVLFECDPIQVKLPNEVNGRQIDILYIDKEGRVRYYHD